MARRSIFVPQVSNPPFTREVSIEFEWFPGFSKTQAQKSIRSLHKAAAHQGLSPVLEISSKSEDAVGVKLSAFNLSFTMNGQKMSVECAFQGSKVFEWGGPYQDLYKAASIEAKRDNRIKQSGELIGFRLFKEDFPTRPFTAFYDWLYLRALAYNPILASRLLEGGYKGFTDIAFNPEYSINCQARSAALYVALRGSAEIDFERIIADRAYYLKIISSEQKNTSNQDPIPPIQLTLD